MNSFTQIIYSKHLGRINCNICSNSFSDDSIIFIPHDNFAYICETCYIVFSLENIKEFLALFDKYGGFFGKRKNNRIPIDEFIKELFDLLNYKNNVDNIETNMKLRHKVLLYGYTPEQLMVKMKGLIHQNAMKSKK